MKLNEEVVDLIVLISRRQSFSFRAKKLQLGQSCDIFREWKSAPGISLIYCWFIDE